MVVVNPEGTLQSPKREHNVPVTPSESVPQSPSSPSFGNQRKTSRMGKLIKVVAENPESKVVLFFFNLFFVFALSFHFHNLHYLSGCDDHNCVN